MNLPQLFQNRITFQFANDSKLFLESLQSEPPVSIRINPEKEIVYGDEKIPWCKTGFYLEQRPSFTLDPLFHAGCYYVQDASSMFLEQVFIQTGLSEKKLLILDACAAPGGKSTHLSSLMNKESLLISNEVIGSRIPVLNENTVKWGNPNVVITNNDPSAFTQLENLFDVILVDAPCSGEGLFRKDPGALEEWSTLNCEICSSRQKRILQSLLPSLKPNGYLIYSTCTYNPAENEEVVRWMEENLSMKSISLELDKEWGVKKITTGGIHAYAFLPHLLKGEGLFISMLKKMGEPEAAISLKTKSTPFSALQNNFSVLNEWINQQDKFTLVQKDEMVLAINKDWMPTIHFLSGVLRITHSGSHVADLKGDKAIPSHELAMSSLLNINSFASAEVIKEDALKFLRKEDFKLDLKNKGYTLVTHQGHPLGWINYLGNRFNNNYPLSWRIRMK